jgi:hypothetical protein
MCGCVTAARCTSALSFAGGNASTDLVFDCRVVFDAEWWWVHCCC